MKKRIPFIFSIALVVVLAAIAMIEKRAGYPSTDFRAATVPPQSSLPPGIGPLCCGFDSAVIACYYQCPTGFTLLQTYSDGTECLNKCFSTYHSASSSSSSKTSCSTYPSGSALTCAYESDPPPFPACPTGYQVTDPGCVEGTCRCTDMTDGAHIRCTHNYVCTKIGGKPPPS